MTKLVRVRRVKPELQRYVREVLWISAEQRTTQLLAPETAPTLVLWLSGTTSFEGGAFSVAAISGVHDRARTVEHAPGCSAIIVRFTELGAACVVQGRGELLFNQSAALEYFIERDSIHKLRGHLLQSGDPGKQIQTLEAFLSERVERAKPLNSEMEAAARFIVSSRGQISVADVARHISASQSSLERHFRSTIGINPKLLGRLSRLNHACMLWDRNKDLTRIAFEAGYSDQPHMIRDFRRLIGLAPSLYFRLKSARNLPLAEE